MLGLDPLNVANEGKLIAIVDAAHAQTLLQEIRGDPCGIDTEIIGEVTEDPLRLVRGLSIGCMASNCRAFVDALVLKADS